MRHLPHRITKWMASPRILGILLLSLALAFYSSHHPLLEKIRNITFDAYQNLQPRTPAPEKMEAGVVIIDLDDTALETYGQWPWPRTLVARLVDRLLQAQALSVGFDIIFAEKDRMSPAEFAKELPPEEAAIAQQLQQLPNHETILANSLHKQPVVLGQVGLGRTTPLDNLPRKVGFATLGRTQPEPYLFRYPGLLRNVTELEEAATGIGLFSFMPGQDGVVRKVPLVERVGAQLYPSLSLEMLRVALRGKDDYIIRTLPEGGIQSVIVKDAGGNGFEVPTTHNGQVWVHFARYTPADPLYISVKQVLELPLAELQQKIGGKLAIIGTSAIGLKDIRTTPLSSATPGVEVHAQVLENILSHTHLTRPDMVVMLELGVILLGGFLLIFLAPRLNALWNFLMTNGLIIGLVAVGWHYYTSEQILLDVAYPSAVVFTLFSVLTYLNYMREEKERQQIRNAFSHYVSPALLNDLAEHPERLQLGGETKNITLLFSDIRGFTTISEMFDAQGLTSFINRFLTPMSHIVLEEKGTIDKYMGDALMAFWNAPLDVANHPFHACRAALRMQQAIKDMNDALKQEADRNQTRHVPISVGVGLNTGDCCVGNMGSDIRFDYSALGDNVNLASRLEGQSKTYGVDIVVSENTYREVAEQFAFIELDIIQVKGKTEPVRIFALLGEALMRQEASYQSLAAGVANMLDAYRQQRFAEAQTLCQTLAEAHPHLRGFWKLYQSRIDEFLQHPPASDWNGVFVATSK